MIPHASHKTLSAHERSIYICIGIAIGCLLCALFAILITAGPAAAHDHSRPDMDEWFMGLRSEHGPCCDGPTGPNKDALHLRDADWETQNKENSHYRVRVPKDYEGFHRALNGEVVETEWVDVPDSALVQVPNIAGSVLVWPAYGSGSYYIGSRIRCFMPGTLG